MRYLLPLFLGLLVPASAWAISGELTLRDRGEPLRLIDAVGVERTLTEGSWELDRDPFTGTLLLTSEETREVVEVTLPAPRSPVDNVWSFHHRGTEIGQKVDLRARTQDRVTASGTRDEARGCVYVDGGACRRGCSGIQIWRTEVRVYNRELQLDFLSSVPGRGAVASIEGLVLEGATDLQQYPSTPCYLR